MLKFAIIAEGPSDQAVIENVLLGFFQDEQDEPAINYVQPLPATSADPAPAGGWTLVLESLRRGDPQKALQVNHYLVIHIDTDVQEEPGFDVPRRGGGVELPVPERAARVIERLCREIDSAFYQAYADRILFAVAVDSIECWLLPLLHDNNKAEKTTGCLEAVNHELRRRGEKGLSSAEGVKFVRAYDAASKDYRKRKMLLKHQDRNPSFKLFIERLHTLPAGQVSAAPGGQGGSADSSEKPPETTPSDPPA